jgi:prepilin-type N-terminal cleavage/methylation domain-containing protein
VTAADLCRISVRRPDLAAEGGFTLLEVLVVILIIAILAAIALTQLVPKKALAQDSEAKMNAGSMYAHVESCAVTTDDYRDCETGDPSLGSTGLAIGSAPGETKATSSGPRVFRIEAASRSGNVFVIVREEGENKSRHVCIVPTGQDPAGCKNGSW